MKIQSTPLTFIDQTDIRKLEVYITSNMPTVQIRNSNSGAFTPNWVESGGLQLKASIFLDSRIMDDEYDSTDIQWYKNDKLITNGSNVPEVISGDDDYHRTLTITSKNVLVDDPIITYTCKAKYQGIDAVSSITFTRVDTGTDGKKGEDGTSAPAVQAQYSANGESGWTEALNTAVHKYIRYSYDGGKLWTAKIKMVGEDGTSVNIKGTATSKRSASGTPYYILEYDSVIISGADIGDAYLLDGNLYVCVDSRDGDDYFMDVGRIQGPQGNDGQSSYVFIRYASDASGSNMTINPRSTTTHIGICAVSTNIAPTVASEYTWSRFVGDNAKSIILSGTSQIFKVSNDEIPTYTPTTIMVSAQTVNTTVELWEYSINGGIKWTTDVPDGVVFDKDANSLTITGKDLTSNTLVIRASNSIYKDIYTVYKVFDGIDGHDGDKGDPASMAFLTNENISFAANANGVLTALPITTNVVAYSGATKQMPMIGKDITGAPDGMQITTRQDELLNEVELTISFSPGTDFGSNTSMSGTIDIPVEYPVVTKLQLSWSKINSGAEGVGIKSTTVSYGSSSSSSVQPTDWKLYMPTVAEGEYLWTRTVIDYTDDNVPDTVTYIYAKQGYQGETGARGMSITVTSIQYQEGASATTAPTGTWSNAVVAVADGKYLWTKTTFSDGNTAYGVAKQGISGTPASLVDITPSALYFKSTTGNTGTFMPEYIYLYPRFQNATYSNWQYSRDGGVTWVAASGANGLTINTYNSVPYSLRIDRASTLYTNTVTSISFRCNSTNTSVYDTVSIAKIYDVADLQIGGRNLILRSDFKDLTKWMVSNSAWTKSSETYQGSGVMECDVTDREVSVSLYHDMMQTIPYEKLELNVPYTISFYIKCTSNGNRPFTWYLTNITGTSPDNNWTPIIATTEWVKVSRTITFTAKQNDSEPLMYFRAFNGNKVCITKPKFEVGNTLSDWSPAPEDLVEEAANVNVMLSNEAHFFEATAGGVPVDTSVTLDVVGYKGSVKSATTVGTIVGIPSAGMTATIANNNTTNTKLTIAVTSALTSDIADYGILTIPITVNGHTINKIFNWTKAKAGDVGRPGDDAVTFQVYSNNGYALSTSVPTITLQTFAYVGDVEIKAGATYQWYRHNNTDWVAVSGATNDYFNVSRDDVTFSNNYQCKMQFGGAEYVGVVTIEDKNDENKVFASKPSNYFAGDLWIVGTDYTPPSYTVGTMLRAEHTNTGYTDSDWVPATKYDDEIKDLRDTVDSYKQYFSVNSTNGLQIGNSSINNDILTTDTVNAANINADLASLESLDIIGKYSGSTMLQAPVINLGKFSIVIESNGSLSIVANT